MENDERILETVNWIKRLFAKSWLIENICVTGHNKEELIVIIKEVFPQSTYISSSLEEISWSIDNRTLVAKSMGSDEWNFFWN